MTPLKQSAILIRLVREMRQRDSWCGETHVQKGVFVLQELAGVDTGFTFVLYKHGPFSFDLRDHLTAMRADGLLDLRIQPPPYGPKLVPTAESKAIEAKFPTTLNSNDARVGLVADSLGDRGVADLERLATALYITRRQKTDGSVRDRAAKLRQLKPHITEPQSEEAVKEVDELIEKAKKLQTCLPPPRRGGGV